MATRALIWRFKIGTIVVASTMTCMVATGCRSGMTMGRVPGFNWLSWKKDKAPPTLASDNDPTGHLPPPSAAADPYPASDSNTLVASRTTNGSRNETKDGYPTTGYPLTNAASEGGRNYQTGPYDTGSVASDRSAAGNDRYIAQSEQEPTGSRYDSFSGVRRGAAEGVNSSPSDRATLSSSYNDTVDPYSRDDRSRGQGYAGAYGRGDTEFQPSTGRDVNSGNQGADRNYATPQNELDRGSQYASNMESATPRTEFGPQDDYYRQARASTPQQREDEGSSYADHGSRIRGYDRTDVAGGNSGADLASERPREVMEPYSSQWSTSANTPTDQPWRPGTTSDYSRVAESPDSSRLQPASHYGNLPAANAQY